MLFVKVSFADAFVRHVFVTNDAFVRSDGLIRVRCGLGSLAGNTGTGTLLFTILLQRS